MAPRTYFDTPRRARAWRRWRAPPRPRSTRPPRTGSASRRPSARSASTGTAERRASVLSAGPDRPRDKTPGGCRGRSPAARPGVGQPGGRSDSRPDPVRRPGGHRLGRGASARARQVAAVRRRAGRVRGPAGPVAAATMRARDATSSDAGLRVRIAVAISSAKSAMRSSAAAGRAQPDAKFSATAAPHSRSSMMIGAATRDAICSAISLSSPASRLRLSTRTVRRVRNTCAPTSSSAQLEPAGQKLASPRVAMTVPVTSAS